MKLSICSYSFHRLLEEGKQDIYQYIEDCKVLGCTHLDPWNAHLSKIFEADQAINADNLTAQSSELTADEEEYLARIRQAADKVGLPFGCIAVDRANIYEETEQQRKVNRAKAYRWISVAEKLGASHIRIDAGGPEVLNEQIFAIIVEGYKDVLDRARKAGVQVVVENHWGPTIHPKNVIKLLEALPELGLLLDSNNWARNKQAEGWLSCMKYAKVVHVKTFIFNEEGQELTQNIRSFCQLLLKNGYDGCWGVESVPTNDNEIEAASKTIKLIKESLK